MNNHLSYKMEGDKSTDYNDDYYKNVKLVGFVKTDTETLPGYKNDGFQWSSSDDLSNFPPTYHNENNRVPSKYFVFLFFFFTRNACINKSIINLNDLLAI